MKIKHTQKKSANRGMNPNYLTKGMSQNFMHALFAPKRNSQTQIRKSTANKQDYGKSKNQRI